MFKSKRKQQPAPAAPEPFDEWAILTTLPDGHELTLRGGVYNPDLCPEMLRYVDALASGLTAAGYEAEVRISRKQVVSRLMVRP